MPFPDTGKCTFVGNLLLLSMLELRRKMRGACNASSVSGACGISRHATEVDFCGAVDLSMCFGGWSGCYEIHWLVQMQSLASWSLDACMQAWFFFLAGWTHVQSVTQRSEKLMQFSVRDLPKHKAGVLRMSLTCLATAMPRWDAVPHCRCSGAGWWLCMWTRGRQGSEYGAMVADFITQRKVGFAMCTREYAKCDFELDPTTVYNSEDMKKDLDVAVFVCFPFILGLSSYVLLVSPCDYCTAWWMLEQGPPLSVSWWK